MMETRWARLFFLAAFFCSFAFGQPSITRVHLTYKRDPRQVDPYRGIKPWVDGPSFTGATAQDTVEVRAEGVDAASKVIKISPQWTPSDAEMVTVSPSRGDDVKITIHRPGESQLKIDYQGFSMDLVVKARNVGKFLVFEIAPATAPAPAPKPAMHRATENAPSSNSDSDVSYAIGMNLAAALRDQSVKVEANSLFSGLKDGLSGGQARMTGAQAMAVMKEIYIDPRMVEQVQSRQALAEKNKREGEAFLAENKNKEGVVTLPTGLQYKILKAGEGKRPSSTDVVNVQYRGTFINGKEFESTIGRGTSNLPVDKVIKGWAEALQLMPVGSKWQIFVPSDLAYGERGAGGHAGGKRAGAPRPQVVGPNQTLVFDLELLGIQDPGAASTSELSAEKSAVTPEMLQQLVKAVQAAQPISETGPEKHQGENQ